MIKLLPNSEIDRVKWNKCVSSAENASVFSLAWYLDAIHPEWYGLIKDDFVSVVPICTSKKVLHKSLVQPVFSRYTNVFPYDSEFVDFYSNYLNSFDRVACCYSVRFSKLRGEFTNKVYQEIRLNSSYEIIRLGYAKNALRILKRNSESISVQSDEDFKKTIKLFSSVKARELGFKKARLESLENLMLNAIQNKMAFAVHAYGKQGELLATGFFLRFQGIITYLKGASTDEGKKTGAMYSIMDYVIKTNSEKFEKLDFGGSNVFSVAQFFKKFGAYDVPYYLYSQGKEPVYIKVLKRLKQKLSKNHVD
ncbi:MAG: hypothetical protein ACK4K0_11490 [Flavobacteriales bacterium]